MKKIQIEPAKAFSHEAVYGRDKYTAQNVLYLQVNFPVHAFEGDILDSAWSDRAYAEWEKAARHLPRDRSFAATDDESFLKFAAALVGHPIDGARAVRYSDAGGFEVFRIDTWEKGADSPSVATYSGMSGPNIIRPRPKYKRQTDGRFDLGPDYFDRRDK